MNYGVGVSPYLNQFKKARMVSNAIIILAIFVVIPIPKKKKSCLKFDKAKRNLQIRSSKT